MPQQTEPNANYALCGLLRNMLSRSTVHSENTRSIVGHAGLHPDVLVITPGAAPVVVEAEFEPAYSVESEAKDRLGLEETSSRRVIEAVVALRYPESVQQAYDLTEALKSARLSYCVFTEESDGASRFPTSGWLEGSVEDLADMVRLVSVPQRAVDAATLAMEQGIDRVAALLDKRVVCDLLGFDGATYEAVRRLSAKWCAEPSVHGGKARPRGSSLVV